MRLRRNLMITFWSIYGSGNGNLTTMKANRFVPPAIVQHFSCRLNTSLVPKYPSYILTSKEIEAVERMRKKTLSKQHENAWHRIEDTYLNPYFSPLLADTFVGLPPTIIYAAQHDILRDDSFYYAEQLRIAGVHVQFFLDEDGYHGSFWTRADRIGLSDAVAHVFD